MDWRGGSSRPGEGGVVQGQEQTRPSADLRQEKGAARGRRWASRATAQPTASLDREDWLEQPCLLSSPRQRPWSCSPGKATHTGTCCGRGAGLARAQAASAGATVSSPSGSATTWLALREAWGRGLIPGPQRVGVRDPIPLLVPLGRNVLLLSRRWQTPSSRDCWAFRLVRPHGT